MSMTSAPGWPPLPRGGDWPATQDYLHLLTQMMGKVRLALSPTLPEWSHASLALGSRGVTTGAMPWGDRSIEVTLDVVDGTLAVRASDGSQEGIPVLPARSIAGVWADLTGVLDRIGVEARMWDRPQERADTTPFGQDHRQRTWDAASVASWFTALVAVHNVFDAWRSSFFGRTGIGFWWGGFDMTLMVFNGRHATPRPDAGYITRYDLDAESLVIGFWPGGARHEPMVFGYIVPEPPGCEVLPLHPPAAGWVAEMSEWVLPYDAVRAAPDPRGDLVAFIDTVYAAAGSLAGWDLAAHRYDRPPRPS
jgi:hypothetical protein